VSDTYSDDQLTEDEDRVVSLRRSQIRALEDKARRADEATQRADAAERQLAFAQAGVSLDDPKTKWFVKGYDGEVTVEDIRAAAAEAGFIGETRTRETIPANEQAAHQRMAGAAAGADPTQTTLTVDDMAKAQSPEDVLRMAGDLGMLAERQ